MKKFGPFRYFRVKKKRKHFITAWLDGYDNSSFGWEWGTDGECVPSPAYCLRVAHFTVVSYEKCCDGGFIVVILGFWWMK